VDLCMLPRYAKQIQRLGESLELMEQGYFML